MGDTLFQPESGDDLCVEIKDALKEALALQEYKIKFMGDKGLESCVRITLGRKEQTQAVCDTILRIYNER